MDASIALVVCTFNRARALGRLLSSVLRLHVPADLTWEVVVVDNNSRDQTSEVVRGFAAGLPLVVASEPTQGKAHALNRAIRTSSADLLLFCDDDVVLASDWLLAYRRTAAAAPTAGWFGGRVLPLWPAGRPRWLTDESLPALSGFFAAYDLGEDERPYTIDDKLPIGANMGVRREVFERIGIFRTDLGPRGVRRGTGEDTELIERALAAGIGGLYVGTAVARHVIPAERLRIRSFLDYGIGKGINEYRLRHAGEQKGSYRQILDQVVRAMPQALRGRWDRVRICAVNVGLEIGYKLAMRHAPTE
jgi:glycosyltransferase involved in cell wall biosynthesis